MPSETPPPPNPPPWGMLIRRARAVSGLSPERAAEGLLISLSGSRWRQIEAGYVLKRGAWVKTGWVDDTVIAHMAWAVGVDPDQLAEAGRPEAAEITREIARRHPRNSSNVADDIDAALARLEAKIERMKRDPRKRRKLEAMIDLIDDETG